MLEQPLTAGLGAAYFLGSFAFAGWAMREMGKMREAIREQRKELRDAHGAIRFLRRFAQFGFEAGTQGEGSSPPDDDGGDAERR